MSIAVVGVFTNNEQTMGLRCSCRNFVGENTNKSGGNSFTDVKLFDKAK